jgi:hypothetical protein
MILSHLTGFFIFEKKRAAVAPFAHRTEAVTETITSPGEVLSLKEVKAYAEVRVAMGAAEFSNGAINSEGVPQGFGSCTCPKQNHVLPPIFVFLPSHCRVRLLATTFPFGISATSFSS